MNLRVLVKQAVDGGVDMFEPTFEHVSELMAAGATFDEAMASIAARFLPGGIAVKPTVAFAHDRLFRTAWRLQGSSISVDMPVAKSISHAHRRARRSALFQPLDVEATIPAKAAQAEAARQVIRDADTVVQNSIDAASTPEQLKQILVEYGVFDAS